MKNIKKVAIVLMVLVLAMSTVIFAVACDQKSAAEGTFVLEVRKYNGANSLGVVNTDGELLASTKIKVEEGQTYVSEALAKAATEEGGLNKISFGKTDYILFSKDTWFISNGYMSKETNYVAEDYTWSYVAYNGTMSNGATADLLDGLTVYTIVIDGWDGVTGSTKS